MLTDKQRETLTESIWVINSVIKELGLQGNDEMRSIANLFLTQAILQFDETRGVKWTTYAYRSLFLYLKRVNAKEIRRQSKIVSDTKLCYIEDKKVKFEEEYFARETIKRVAELCNEQEKEILQYKLLEYSNDQIGEILGLSRERIRQIWCGVKQKAIQNINVDV